MKKLPEMKINQNKTKYINPLNISVLIKRLSIDLKIIMGQLVLED